MLKHIGIRNHTIIRPATFGGCHLAARNRSKNIIHLVFAWNGCNRRRCLEHECVKKSNENGWTEIPIQQWTPFYGIPMFIFSPLQKPQRCRHHPQSWSNGTFSSSHCQIHGQIVSSIGSVFYDICCEQPTNVSIQSPYETKGVLL